MKYLHFLPLASLTLALTACGSSSDSNDNTEQDKEDNTPVVSAYGPYSTGTSSDSNFVYFDLDAGTALELTEEEAIVNADWDIAFKRTGVYLNTHADNTTVAYFTANNADFYDEQGTAVTEKFLAATAETELEDYTSVTLADVPADDSAFVADQSLNILDGFYNYDMTTHIVTAADDHYFVVNSDDTFSKFRFTEITTEGRYLGSFKLGIANQGISATEFDTETELSIDAIAACAAWSGVYIDFDLKAAVASTDAYDIYLPCNDDNSAASFEMHLASDATAIQDFSNEHTGIDTSVLRYYYFQSDIYNVRAFDQASWYAYNLEGNHKLWSQYGVYLVKTPTATYKLQITSYYNEAGESGNYSFRADALTE
ncbi:HmuY family protein [Catenovulum sp. 2E275]|uniref:HmuY family protein n=1 Tax=Catenovulum sp. 2E275 TaxID=2980497 RepID=UPI0021CE214B|nr:HmuY family protein [Catenovulum sp. 2E275]MCU4677490.1 HmuY family protein [Catenovulum sp. 2E275]